MRRFVFYLFCCLSAALFTACGPQEPPRIAVTGISLDPVKVTMTEGESTTLVATVLPADATDKSIAWSSSNTATATVSESGLVTALHAGTTVITAKTNDGGITASCTVNVDIALAALTGEASHISCRNATIAGKANLPAKTATDLTFGILYSNNSGVLLGKATQIEAENFDADYNYSVITETLEPETTYYYRSYISQNNEITYGDTKSFTTLPISSMIKTEDATDINPYDAVLNASLDLTDCRYETLEYGFKLKQEGGQESTLKATGLAETVYSVNASDLSRERTYEVTAYVSLDGRTYQGETKEFSTQSIQASVSWNEVTDITELKATVSGKLTVTSQGSFEKSAKLFYSSSVQTASELQSTGTSKELSLATDGLFSQVLTGLSPSTTYHCVVVSTVDGVLFVSEVLSFVTASYSASVTATVTDITEFKATLNGTLTVNSIENLSKRVQFYYSETAKDLTSLKSNGIRVTATLSSDGSFSKQLTGLKENTEYYYVACAFVSGIELCSDVKSFNTATIGIDIMANDATGITEFKATLNGSLEVNSIENLSRSVHFYYSATASDVAALRSSGTKVISSTLSSSGTFTGAIVGLTHNTTYYYIACANVNGQEYTSEVKSFKTANYSVAVAANDATGITEFKGTLNGKLTVNSIEDLSKSVYFYYSETANDIASLKSDGTMVASTLASDGTFSSALSYLIYDTKYYYVACATVNGQEFTSEVNSFKTSVFSLTITTGDASGVGTTKATLTGELSISSQEYLSPTAFFIYGTDPELSAGQASIAKQSDGLITVSLSYLHPSTTYYYRACTQISFSNLTWAGEIKSFTTLSEAIDMGLSVKWGSLNIGASSPEDYGDYYAWGETTTKSIYDWSTYILCSGSSKTLTKYCTQSRYGTVDNITILDPKDDVARVKLGEKWRMPTELEWAELINTDNCSWIWTTQNDVNGYLVTSKITGNSIFLPAPGLRSDDLRSDGKFGSYWSTSLVTDNSAAASRLFFSSDNVTISNAVRSFGGSVRPVCDY